MKTKANHTTRNPKAIKCSCKSEYQDALYGPGMRLHNPKAHATLKAWRCTVCGKETTSQDEPSEVKADKAQAKGKKG